MVGTVQQVMLNRLDSMQLRLALSIMAAEGSVGNLLNDEIEVTGGSGIDDSL